MKKIWCVHIVNTWKTDIDFCSGILEFYDSSKTYALKGKTLKLPSVSRSAIRGTPRTGSGITSSRDKKLFLIYVHDE